MIWRACQSVFGRLAGERYYLSRQQKNAGDMHQVSPVRSASRFISVAGASSRCRHGKRHIGEMHPGFHPETRKRAIMLARVNRCVGQRRDCGRRRISFRSLSPTANCSVESYPSLAWRVHAAAQTERRTMSGPGRGETERRVRSARARRQRETSSLRLVQMMMSVGVGQL